MRPKTQPLTPEIVVVLMKEKRYDLLLTALNDNAITPHYFNSALRQVFRNDMSNPDFRELFKQLWRNNNNMESLGLIAERLQELLLLYPDSTSAPALIIELLLSCNTKNGAYFLGSVLASYQVNKYTLEVLANLDSTFRNKVLQQLIPRVLYKCNVKLLQQLHALYPEQMKIIVANPDAMNAELVERASLMLKTDPDAGDEMCQAMEEFTEKPGKITLNGGLLTCARISNEKKYDFNPTIIAEIDGDDSFMDDYISLLREMPLPLRERFIIAGLHWLCGDVQIDEKGNISIVLINSLGSDASSTKKCYDSFKKIFPDANIVIYISNEKRQYSEAGCSVFSLDDTKQLFTIENYLDKKYEQSGLHGYMRDHAIGSDKYIIRSELPIKFLRLMQKQALLTQFFPARPVMEQQMAINRKGQTAEESARNLFYMNRNMRMNKILLVNFAEKNADYLLKTDPEIVKKTIHRFTVEGFSERVQALKQRLKMST